MSVTTLKPVVSKLRECIIKGIAGKLEKYGFDETGYLAINKPLSDYDETIRENLIALFEAKHINGRVEYLSYIHDVSRTFLHVVICFKLMEKRGIMNSLLMRLIGEDVYNEILPDFLNVNSIAYDAFVHKYQTEIEDLRKKDNYEECDDYYQFIYLMEKLTREMAQEVPLLFQEYEYNLVQPDYDDLRIILQAVATIEEDEFKEDDFLGWIYQYWVDTDAQTIAAAKEAQSISYANQIYYQVLLSLDQEQTEFGEFYTPRWIVKYIVDHCIRYYRENNDIPVEQIKLLDPACGAGNFLVYSFDAMLKLYEKEHPDWTAKEKVASILEHNIFGSDVQREPLQITALNLWIKAISYVIKENVKDFSHFKVNILKANSLYPWESEEEFHQMSLFEQSDTKAQQKFSSEDIGRLLSNRNTQNRNSAIHFYQKKYDIIVMNPPFVDTRNMPQDTKKFMKKYYPKNSRNFVAAFIERALAITKETSIIGFIASDTFKTLVSYKNLRKMLLDQVSIRKMIELGYGVFEADVSCGMYFLDKIHDDHNMIEYIDARKMNKKSEDSFEELYQLGIEEIQQKLFYEYQDYVFLTDLPQSLRKLYAKKKCLGLGEQPIAECRVGIKIGDNEDHFVTKKWNVPEEYLENRQYVLISKTNSESYIRDYQDAVYWNKDGSGIRSNPGCLWQNSEFYFRRGLSYNLGGRIFKVRKLPENVLFTQGSSGIFFHEGYEKYEDYFLGILKSKVVNYFLLQMNPTNNTTPNDVKKIPIVMGDKKSLSYITELSRKIQKCIIERKHYVPLSDYYIENALVSMWKDSILLTCQDFIRRDEELYVKEYEISYELEQAVYELYQITSIEQERIEDELGRYYIDNVELTAEQEECISELYLHGRKSDGRRKVAPMSVMEISECLKLKPRLIFEYLSKNQIYKGTEIQTLVMNYLRYLVQLYMKESSAKLYTAKELTKFVTGYVESHYYNGVELVEEIESVMGTSIACILHNGVKIGTTRVGIAGSEEPMIKEAVLSGKGKLKESVLWYQPQFRIDFDESRQYAMQNEIRRLKNEVYLPKLQRLKEKIQKVSEREQKNVAKEIETYEDSVKTLETWKVVE